MLLRHLESLISKKIRLLSFPLLILLISLIITRVDFASAKNAAPGDNIEKKKSSTFSVMACVTWWSHDAVGYHPAMFLLLENKSGHEIAGDEIPFQARFTDLREGYVTVAREYKRTPVHDHERFALFLRGPRSFELPIDSSVWRRWNAKPCVVRMAAKEAAIRQLKIYLLPIWRV